MLGLPDKDYGEAVCAIVIPDSEIKRKQEEELKPALTLEELSTWAKVKLAPYKVSHIDFLEVFFMNSQKTSQCIGTATRLRENWKNYQMSVDKYCPET